MIIKEFRLVIQVDRYSVLGISAIGVFSFTFTYQLIIGALPDAFNFCYISILVLGLGLLTDDRLIFGIGTFFVIFPLVTVILLIVGPLSFNPQPFNFWLFHGISTHIFAVIVAIVGYKKKYSYFHRSTWWASTILMAAIWFLVLFLNNTDINVNFTLGPPTFLEPLGLIGFIPLAAISVTCLWFIINRYLSEQKQKDNNLRFNESILE